LDGCAEYRWPLLFCPGSSFRSRLSRGDGTGNGPMNSLRPSLITEHHSVSSLNDPAREALPCSRYLRPACDVDTTCTVGGNVHESMATKVRAHRAPNLLSGCVGRSDRRALTTKLTCGGRCKSVVSRETRIVAPVRCGAGFGGGPQSARAPERVRRNLHDATRPFQCNRAPPTNRDPAPLSVGATDSATHGF
jgi:hypothetical protein